METNQAPIPAEIPVATVTNALSTVNYAGFGARLLAMILDGIIFGFAFGVIAVILTMPIVAIAGSDSSGGSALTSLITFPLGLISVVVYLYFVATKGQTPGKMIMKIKIVKKGTSDVPGWGGAILRDVIGRMANGAIFYLGYLWMLWDTDKQTWADKIAGTVVVKI